MMLSVIVVPLGLWGTVRERLSLVSTNASQKYEQQTEAARLLTK